MERSMDEPVNQQNETENATTENALEGIQQAQGSQTPPGQLKEQDKQQEKEAQTQEAKPETQNRDDGPIVDWAQADLTIPRDEDFDKNIFDAFGKLAVEHGLSKKQAQALIDWQYGLVGEARKQWEAEREKYLDGQEKALKEAWGRDAKVNQEKIVALVGRISALKGCEEFGKALGKTGAADNAAILKGLLGIANLLDEDGVAARTNATGAAREESAYEGIMDAYARAGNTRWNA